MLPVGECAVSEGVDVGLEALHRHPQRRTPLLQQRHVMHTLGTYHKTHRTGGAEAERSHNARDQEVRQLRGEAAMARLGALLCYVCWSPSLVVCGCT